MPKVLGVGALAIGLSVLTLASSSAGARSLAQVREAGYLRVGMPGDLPPFNLEAVGRWSGFEPDMITAVAKSMGLGVRFVKLPSDELFAALNSDKIDIAMNNYAMTSTREKNIDFSAPYACSGVSIVSAQPGLNKNTDLIGKTIGVSKGSIMVGYVDKLPFDKKVKTFESNQELIQAVATGNVDATYAWNSMQATLQKIVRGPAYWSPELWKAPAGIALASGNNSLRQSLNVYTARYLRTNEAVQLMKKYYNQDVTCK